MAANPAPSAQRSHRSVAAGETETQRRQRCSDGLSGEASCRHDAASRFPLRPGGALVINAFKFGALEKAKSEIRKMAMRQTISMIPGVTGSVASSTIPTQSNANPMPREQPTA